MFDCHLTQNAAGSLAIDPNGHNQITPAFILTACKVKLVSRPFQMKTFLCGEKDFLENNFFCETFSTMSVLFVFSRKSSFNKKLVNFFIKKYCPNHY